MQLGVVGKPNVGKSTFFAAATLAPAAIADYPFTTVEPNVGVAYLRARCPHLDLGTACIPHNAPCETGVRMVPVELIDVAGLVPGAHEGRGLGNQFLDDLRQAASLIHVVDASGGTDFEGRTVERGTHDPLADVHFLEEEVSQWIKGILARDWVRLARKADLEERGLERMLYDKLTGLGVTDVQIKAALGEAAVPARAAEWDDAALLRLAVALLRRSKPIVVAANKADLAPAALLEKLQREARVPVVPTFAEAELALRRAAKAGFVRYTPGADRFDVVDEARLSKPQREALAKIADVTASLGGTGVQRCLEMAAFELLRLIVVYPVEDEAKWTDKEGRVLPDAFLVPRGSTARDVAYKVHTDLGEHFIRAINARTKRVVGHDYEVRDGDVLKIVAKA